MKSTLLPIWITDKFRPVRVRFIGRMAELLLWLDIIRGLDITVVCGSNHFRVGQGELEMMTYNDGNRCVLPLVPTACAYANLNDYFREMQKGKLRFCRRGGIFGAIWKFGK